MKKILSIIAFAAMLTSCYGGKYTITGKTDLPDMEGKMAYLTNYDTQDTIDSVTIKGNTYHFEGKVEEGYMARIIVGRTRNMMVVENGNIVIDEKTGDATGTETNDTLVALDKKMQAIEKENVSIEEQYKAKKLDEAAYEKANDAILKKMADFLKAAYQDNKGNAIGPWALLNYAFYAELSAADIEAELEDAPSHYKTMRRIEKALDAAKKAEATAEGKKFVDFVVKTEDGMDQHLSSFVGKGNYVLVDFWASWCGPCRKETKTIKEIYDRYNGKGLSVLGVAVWDKPKDTAAAIEALALPWPQIINADTIPSSVYGFNAIPHIIIFSPDGTILSRGLQGEQLKAKVDEIMKGK